MIDGPTEKRTPNFFTLDVKTKKNKKHFKNMSQNSQSKLFENEWLQEYELIYLSHRYEDWNLEEVNSH